MKFEEYINRQKVLQVLIKYRAKIAHSRHKTHLITGVTYFKDFIQDFHEPSEDEFVKELLSVMPPRRSWTKLDRNGRKKYRDSYKRNMKSLNITIKQAEARGKNPDWLKKLNCLIDNLIKDVLSSKYKLSSPIILPLVKKRKKGKTIYRPIAKYNLTDRVVIGLVAKYLTDVFDWSFKRLNCAYAFRSVRFEKGFVHHDAIMKIKKYIEERNSKPVFVAESDIKKFFDSVNHELVLKCLRSIVDKTRVEIGIETNDIALRIFNQYLKSYQYNRDVYSKNKVPGWFKSVGVKRGIFEWEEEGLKEQFYPEGLPENIGVPQGGAISCLISNLILEAVDIELLSSSEFKNDSELLYIRYCDDMIIMHTDYEKCNRALSLYNKGISECKLLYHEYKQSEFKYGYNTWSAKSKPIYKLSKPDNGPISCIPWTAFVGYQIRYDGVIRVRKASIEKEKLKQKKERLRIIKALGSLKSPHQSIKNIRIPAASVTFRLEQRYISMSVGRVKLHELQLNANVNGMCWTNGFRALTLNRVAVNQLKELDRAKRANMIKLIKRLKYLSANNYIIFQEKDKKKDKDPTKWMGHPFSYHYFLTDKKKTFSNPAIPPDIVK